MSIAKAIEPSVNSPSIASTSDHLPYLILFFEIKVILSRLTMGASNAMEMQKDIKYEATRFPKYRISLKSKQTRPSDSLLPPWE